MRRLGRTLRQRQPSQAKTIAQKVAAILRKYGTDAHVYLPGIGVINGLTAGNYLDSAGTTAATVDNPVGLVLDAAGSVGAELVTNGDFSNGLTGWKTPTVGNGAVVSGEYELTTTTTGVNFVDSNSYPTVIGKAYVVSGTYYQKNAGGTVYVGVADGSVYYNNTTSQSPVNFTCVFTATTTESVVRLRYDGGAIGRKAAFDNISVKAVTGIHALQATTANKPILRRGAVNLLTYSEQFDNAAWQKSNVTAVQNNAIAPNGTLTAATLTANANSAYCRQTLAGITGITVNSSFWLRRKTGIGSVFAYVGSGALTQVLSLTSDWTQFNTPPAIGGASTNLFGILFGISGDEVEIWHPQLETGSTASTYIPTTTAAASSATGNYHWVHDSTDVLTATFPAGYESATTINASTAGQSTLTAQNIVGAYNIGPSIDTYGRFVFRTGLTASELAIIQSFANRLAGL